MAIKDLMELSARQVNALDGAELRRAFKSVSMSLRNRRAAFEKAGKLSAMPARYRQGIRKAGSFETPAEMREYIANSLGWMRGKVSTYKGYEEVERSQREQVEKTTGRKFESQEEYNRWGNFMGEMQTRLGASWKAISKLAWEMFDEAKRLNLDPEQLMKNFEYWAEHLEDLKDAEPLKRGRELRPSDYLKKLKLEKIGEFYSREERTYSGKARKPSRGRKGKKGK